MLRIFLLFTCFLISFVCSAQQFNIVKKVADLQVESDTFYNEGLLKSQLIWKKGKKTAEDNNIFFTALTVYTLQSIIDSLPETERKLVQQIREKAAPNFSFYSNRKGGLSYNFYPVRPVDKPFPGLKRISRWEVAKLPDDLDDTSLLYLIKESTDSSLKALKALMTQQVYQQEKIASTLKKYRYTKAYRTWFADKMKQDLDVCVNTNIMLLTAGKGLLFNSVDSASLTFIADVIKADEHKEKPQFISPHYPNTAIILYHVARLIPVVENEQFLTIKAKVIQDLYEELRKCDNEMEKVILLSSLFRLGEKTEFSIHLKKLKKDMQTFYWFKANSFCNRNLLVKRIIGKSNFLQYQYRSEAYYWSLIAELKVLTGAKLLNTDTLTTLL